MTCYALGMDYYDDPVLEEYWTWFTQDDIHDLKLFAVVVIPCVIIAGTLFVFTRKGE